MKNWITQHYIATGVDHKKGQLPCQDALTIVQESDLLLAVAADGVGNLSNSHIASKAAVEAMADWFRNNARSMTTGKIAIEAIRRYLLPHLQENNLEKARTYGVLPESMDCNLAFAAILPAGNFAVWGVLGDGAVCIFRKDQHRVLSALGSVTANGTETIMQPEAAKLIQMDHCTLSDDRLLGFMVMTDGLENEIYRKNSVFLRKRAESYFNAMLLPDAFQRKATVEALVKELPDDFVDDISLVIISNADRRKPIVLDPDPTWLCSCGTRNPLENPQCRSCFKWFHELYRPETIGTSPELYFYRLNRDPARERQLVGLPPLEPEPAAAPEPAAPRSPARGKVHSDQRLSPGQMRENQKKPVPPEGPGSAVRRSVSNGRSGDVPTGTDSEEKTATERIDVRAAAAEAVKKKERDAAATPKKHAGNRWIFILIAAIAAAALIAIVSMVVGLVSAHMRISSLDARVEELTQMLLLADPGTGTYTVVSDHVYLWEIEDGEKTRLDRLETETRVTRLDDELQVINDVEYIHVRTENGTAGWCNLAAMEQLETDDMS